MVLLGLFLERFFPCTGTVVPRPTFFLRNNANVFQMLAHHFHLTLWWVWQFEVRKWESRIAGHSPNQSFCYSDCAVYMFAIDETENTEHWEKHSNGIQFVTIGKQRLTFRLPASSWTREKLFSGFWWSRKAKRQTLFTDWGKHAGCCLVRQFFSIKMLETELPMYVRSTSRLSFFYSFVVGCDGNDVACSNHALTHSKRSLCSWQMLYPEAPPDENTSAGSAPSKAFPTNKQIYYDKKFSLDIPKSRFLSLTKPVGQTLYVTDVTGYNSVCSFNIG